MASSRTQKTERFTVFDPTTSAPQQAQEGDSEGNPTRDDPEGSTTCCKCPVCTCGSECSCPKGEAPGCDPCATFLKGEAATTSSGATTVPGTSGASALAASALVEPPPQPQTRAGALDDSVTAAASRNLDLDIGSPSCSTATASLPTASTDRGSTTADPTTTATSPSTAAAADAVSSAAIKSPPGSEAQRGPATGAGGDSGSGGAPGGNNTAVTPEEQKALRKERRERARNAKRAQTKRGGRSRRYEGKRRWSTNGGAGDKGKKENAPDAFDEWLGVKLKAWRDGEVAPEGADAVPPEEIGVLAEFDFDPSKDELAFPSSLSPLQRGQVHGWAMQLALFHASSGEDTERHVIISKTGTFQGKVLTRGGRTWYKEGVIAPVVERFALQQGNEAAVKDIVASLHSFHESVQLHEPGYAKWLRTHAPGSLDGTDLAQAQEAFSNWPLLHHGELEYVDTPGGLSSLVEILESCTEFGFDLEAHNARTYHGLTCLLQISTEDKDYVVDPLAEGMWDSMPLLRGPFGNSGILKIGHSIRSCDVPSLYRDFGIVIVNAFDTEEAVHALGEKHSGLGRVLENAGVKELHDIAGLKQSMQACDWRERPLSAEKLVYARCDSHYLIPLWRLLRARLLAADTIANREDAQEERELLEIKRRLEKEQQEEKQKLEKEAIGDRLSTGSPGLETEFDLAAASPGFPLAGADGKMRRGSGSVSPVQMPGEPWTSEWDDPEDCHRRERSRSGSSFRSGLGSINEGEFGGGASVRNSFCGMDGALQASFQEGDAEEEEGGHEGQDEEEEEEASGLSSMNGNDNDPSFADLGDNLMEEDEHEEQDDTLGEDEDEDMWDGWGQDDPSEEVKGDAPAETPNVANNRSDAVPPPPQPAPVFASIPEAAPTSNGPAPPMPDRVGSVPDNSPDTLSPVSPPPPSEAGGMRMGVRRGGGRTGRRGPEGSPQPEQHVVLTDGVRLMWKSLSRAQLAASVLWRPAAAAKRKDSHNERHFRTAVQRLQPPRWTEVNVRVYEEIYLWRDRTARRVDDGPTYVCPGDTLIDVALALPTTLDALRRVSAPLSPVLGHGDTPEAVELVGVLRVALGLPEEEPQEAGSADRGIGAGAVNGVAAVSEAVGGGAVDRAVDETVDSVRVEGDDGSKAGARLLLALSMATLAIVIAFVKRRIS